MLEFGKHPLKSKHGVLSYCPECEIETYYKPGETCHKCKKISLIEIDYAIKSKKNKTR